MAECCLAEPTCDNIDGNGGGTGSGISFSSCVSGVNHLMDDLAVICQHKPCIATDCCDANPTCGDIDGLGTAMSSCGTGYSLKSDLSSVVCTTGSCTELDCCTPNPCAPASVENSDKASENSITGTTGESVVVKCDTYFHIYKTTDIEKSTECLKRGMFAFLGRGAGSKAGSGGAGGAGGASGSGSKGGAGGSSSKGGESQSTSSTEGGSNEGGGKPKSLRSAKLKLTCVPDQICGDVDGVGTDFPCTAGMYHLKKVPDDIQCGADGCSIAECCDTNPTCDNTDSFGGSAGSNLAFLSCTNGMNHLKDDLGITCSAETCLASDCCDSNPTCNDIDGQGSDFSSCSSGSTLKDDLTGTCATGTCIASDCCNNPTCNDVYGNGTAFSSCVNGVNHLKDDLTGPYCAASTCAVSDCCDNNPSCDNIDGSGTTFGGCISGTNHLKDTLADDTCANGACVTSDCCVTNPTCDSYSLCKPGFDVGATGTTGIAGVCATGTCVDSECCTAKKCTAANVDNSDKALGDTTDDIVGSTGDTVTVTCNTSFHINGTDNATKVDVQCGTDGTFANLPSCVSDVDNIVAEDITVIIVVVCSSAGAVILLCIIVFSLKKKKKTKEDATNGENKNSNKTKVMPIKAANGKTSNLFVDPTNPSMSSYGLENGKDGESNNSNTTKVAPNEAAKGDLSEVRNWGMKVDNSI